MVPGYFYVEEGARDTRFLIELKAKFGTIVYPFSSQLKNGLKSNLEKKSKKISISVCAKPLIFPPKITVLNGRSVKTNKYRSYL